METLHGGWTDNCIEPSSKKKELNQKEAKRKIKGSQWGARGKPSWLWAYKVGWELAI